MSGRVAGLAMVALALLVPQTALAAGDFYASAGAGGDCSAPSSPCTLDQAILQAQMQPGGANVHVIGPLVRNTSLTLPPSGSTPIHLIGSGSGAGGTFIDTPSDAVRVDAGSSLENVHVRAGGGDAVSIEYGGTLRNAVVEGPTGVNSIFGAGALLPALVDHVTVTGSGFAATVGNGTDGQTLLIRDSVLNGPQGVNSTGGPPVDVVVQRTTINASSVGITVLVNRNARTLVSSSVFRMTGGGSAGISAGSLGDFGTLTLIQNTIDGAGTTGNSSGVLIGPGSSTPATPITADVRDSIVRGFQRDLHALSSSSNTIPGGVITAARSDFGSAMGDPPSGSGQPGSIGNGGGNVNVDPKFVNRSGGNYALSSGSPVIDAAGAAGIAGADQESPTDRAGAARIRDGNGDGLAARDMGAFEFVPSAAVVPGPGVARDGTRPVFASASASPKVFRVDRSGPAELAVAARRHRKGTRFRYSLSESARVVFTIERPRPGRRVKHRCRKPTRKNRHRHRCIRYKRVARFAVPSTAGRNVHRFSGRIGRRALKRGRYRVTLRATDAAGNRSKPKRLRIRVVRR